MDHKSPRDDDLVAGGWTRQFSASEPRLSEAAEAYGEMGLDVRLEPIDAGPSDGTCTACFADNPEFLKVIYTRPAQDNDLF